MIVLIHFSYIQEKQTKEVLAKYLHKINNEFYISKKIISTTTDNGANYVAAFKTYGGHDSGEPLIATEDLDNDGGGVEINDVNAILSEESDEDFKLPKHRRCRYVNYEYIT